MSNSTIGIKIADGSYYPIIQEKATVKKKLILTTVKDNQKSVQIDLYKGNGPEISDAEYIGSLIIENIEDSAKGEPEIELLIGLDQEGNLNASANDKATGESKSLSISLESFSKEGVYDIPEFELDKEQAHAARITPEEETQLTAETYNDEDEKEEKKRKRWSPAALAGFICIGLIIIVLIVFLLIHIFKYQETPLLEAQEDKDIQTTEVSVSEQEEPVVSANETETGSQSEVVEEKPAEPPVAGGVWYKIKRGDTLWDISASFYRNPWLYGKIAKTNKIKNPDLIYTGTKILIPEK